MRHKMLTMLLARIGQIVRRVSPYLFAPNSSTPYARKQHSQQLVERAHAVQSGGRRSAPSVPLASECALSALYVPPPGGAR